MKVEQKFYYLKLGSGNCLAEYWLEGNNVLKRPAIAVYFWDLNEKDFMDIYYNKDIETVFRGYKNHGGHLSEKDFEKKIGRVMNQIKVFVEAVMNKENSIFVTVAHGKVYFYKPDYGDKTGFSFFVLKEESYDDYDGDMEAIKAKGWKIRKDGEIIQIPKYVYVKKINKAPLDIVEDKVPYILASLPSNQSYNRVTIKEVDDWGVKQAIKYCLGEQLETPKNTSQFFELLSPVELETLVFLILTNAGLHVPTWRGGTMPDIDFLTYNFSNKVITLEPVVIKSSQGMSFQVKRKKVNKPLENVDYIIALNNENKNEKILTGKWLLKQVANQPNTRRWLERTLYWFPNIIDNLIARIT